MPFELIGYIVSLFVAAIIAIAISMFSWKRRPDNASIPLALLMGSVAEWILAQTFLELSSSYELKLFWDSVKYLGITIVPVAWLILSLEYTKRERFLSKRNIIIMLIIPAITTILVCTGRFHNLFLTNYHIQQRGSIVELVTTKQVWFWVHTYYSYLLLLIGIILFIEAFFQSPSIYRKQTAILLVGVFIPLISNILTIFNLMKLPYVDITPISLLFTGILFFWGLFKYKLLDIVPIARHAVIESMTDLIIVVDNQKRVVDINPAAKKLIGFEKSNLIGQKISLVLSNWKSLFERYRYQQNVDEDIIIEDGYIQKHYNLRITPILDKKGKVNGNLIILRNITELTEAINQLRESRSIAEAANKAKGQFLSNMSHELRTPMNAIIGMSDLLSPSELSIEQKEYLEIIRTSASSLLKIINDIFDFSKTEAGKLELEKVDFNLRELVTSTITPLLIHANTKNINLFSNISSDIPEILVGDPVRIKQVLLNLISNSIKFTFKGHIEVKVDVLDKTSDYLNLSICVIDTGIGIPEESIDKLFNSFTQLDNSSTRRFGGIGLGLTITKNLIEFMKGSIKVESKLGEGSKFSVYLNLQTKNLINKDTENIQLENSIVKKLKILLAEDNKVNQTLMLTLLKKLNYNVDIADNGLTTVEMAAVGKYDLILMDIQMPELDGIEATSIIRKSEKDTGKHLPIIALTANASEIDKKHCLESGMDDYLTKPVKSQSLNEMISKYTS